MAEIASHHRLPAGNCTHRLDGPVFEAWKRFLVALGGLALAFVAAIFSRVSREAGDFWATLILATVALLLASMVGLRTVPYLARQIMIRRVREVCDYQITGTGVAFSLAAILIAVAALNTGNNLLYIVVASMLAALLVSGFASAITLRRLVLDIRLPEHVYAGKPLAARILLRNLRRLLPCFSVTVIPSTAGEPSKVWRGQRSRFPVPHGSVIERAWLGLTHRLQRRVPQSPGPPPIFEGAAYFPYIPAESELSADLVLRFARRGRYRQDSFALATRFPFSFLMKTRHVSMKRELLVYPAVEPTDEILEVLPLIRGEFESFVRGRGYDLYRIRDYMPEDSARHVDWKATAKSGSLKVREFTREDERKLRIVFDNPAPQRLSAQAYEQAVSLVASLAWHFHGEHAELSFAAPDYYDKGDVYGFLSYLATVEPRLGRSVIEELRPSGEYNIIVTARPRGTIPTAVWSCSYFLFVGDRDPIDKV